MESGYTGFPKGYEHLETVFTPLRDRIDKINDEIENMPPDRGYRPELRPAGAPAPPQISRVDRIAALTKEREDLQGAMGRVAKDAVSNADPTTQKEVLDKTEIMARPEVYNLTTEQLNKETPKRDLDKSQDYANKQLFDAKYLQTGEDTREKNPEISLKSSIDNFVKETENPVTSKVETKEPEISKEQKAEEKPDPKAAFEKSIDNFFNETAIEYSENREDITKEPSIEPSIGPDDNR